jgi:hypothetical protein
VVHCDPKSLQYNLVNMHKVNPNIQEVIAFPNWLSVKQNLQKLRSLEVVLYSSFWTLETKTSLAQEFLKIFILVEQAIRNTLYFGSVA